jgi:DNA-binding transcriptional LysR family regulator
MNELGLDDFELFARVAALGTLSAVARERDVPVSQVSRALARIEKTCGARLIHRSTHALALTAEGEIFLAYSQRMATTIEELQGEFATKAQAPDGLVRVAASTVIAQYLLVPSLPTLAQRHPRLRVEIEVSDRLADMARDGIDIAIRTTATLPETMVARRIGHLGRALYAAPAYLERAGAPRTPDELRQHRLVANSSSPHLNVWPFLVDGQAVAFAAEGWWRANDSGMVATMVLQGLGIGRLATVAAGPLVRDGRLVPVLAGFVDPQLIPIYAVTAASRQRLPKLRACIDLWAQWFGAADGSSRMATPSAAAERVRG